MIKYKKEIREVPYIEGLQHKIFVSNLGEVYMEKPIGSLKGFRVVELIPTYNVQRAPYRVVWLPTTDSVHRSVYVHHLMLTAFRGKRNFRDFTCRYADGDYSNLKIQNLQWQVRSQIDLSHEIERLGLFGEYTDKLNSFNSLATCRDFNAVLEKKYLTQLSKLYTDENKRDFFLKQFKLNKRHANKN